MLESLEQLPLEELERLHFDRFCAQLAAEEEIFLPSRAELVALARRVVKHALRELQFHVHVEACAQLSGELLANAVRHAGGRTLGLRLTRAPGRLRFEVRDSSRALPCRIVAEPGGENGYGLAIVEALSERWGADLLPRGKGVWFELKVRERQLG
ncbi:ATP-binding protein [Kitasatospora sp. MMS16-BH015]|nr:ATP-binding protein [Kitasatospora sp. MMS16-BH015]